MLDIRTMIDRGFMNGFSPHLFLSSRRALFSRAPALLIATFVSVLAAAHPAGADTSSLGQVICNAAANSGPFINLFNWTAYTVGTVFIVQGVLRFKDYYENPGQNPIYQTVARLAGGSFLMTLPAVIGMLIQVLFPNTAGYATSSGSPVACGASVAAAGSNIGLDTMMVNFVNNIKTPLIDMISVAAIVLGVFLIVRGLMKASKYGIDAKSSSVPVIVSSLLIGTVLVVVGQSFGVFLYSLFGSAYGVSVQPSTLLSWTAVKNMGGNTAAFITAITAALTFFQLVGMISFVRGWNVIRNAVEGNGQATIAQGLTHIIGGVLAINIYAFMKIMDATFGTQFVS